MLKRQHATRRRGVRDALNPGPRIGELRDALLASARTCFQVAAVRRPASLAPPPCGVSVPQAVTITPSQLQTKQQPAPAAAAAAVVRSERVQPPVRTLGFPSEGRSASAAVHAQGIPAMRALAGDESQAFTRS
jgi:hypothetical protein